MKMLKKLKTTQKKRVKSGEERVLKFNLFHNGLFKHKVIKNKKKEVKKFNFKKEISSYLSGCLLSI